MSAVARKLNESLKNKHNVPFQVSSLCWNVITLGEREGLIILPKELKYDWPGVGPINYDNDDDIDDDDDTDDDDDNDDNDDFDVFSWYQRTSNSIGTMRGLINYDDDDDKNYDDDDYADVFSKNVFFVGLL